MGSSSAAVTSARAASSGAAAGSGGQAMKFIDRDEHVYFWFPLLAGLSELTFDPRPEIRRSALEVGCAQVVQPLGLNVFMLWFKCFGQ